MNAMKNILIFTLLLFASNTVVYSQCLENSEDKILLVGDSWAFFMGFDNTIDKVMEDWGFPEYKFKTNLTLAENGAKTYDFLKASKQNEIASQLNGNMNIKYVHLSIGGNDVLGEWKSQTFTQFQTDSLINQVKDSLFAIVDFIKDVRPDIDIVWSGYTYPNFEEVVNSFFIPSQHPFYSTWNKMQKPDNASINAILNRFSDEIEEYYENDPRVHFVSATGITQYTYGQESALGVAPYGTYAPKSVPLPYGDPEYPSPMASMRNYGITKDCFHLSQQGYKDLFGYTVQKYYHKAMMDDIYFLAEDDATNGSISSNGLVSSNLFLGDMAGEDYKTILTFNTYGNLDYDVEKASLFLHRKMQIGANPVNHNVEISISNGSFGTTVNIEAEDFDDYGNEFGYPCVYGKNTDGNWVRFDLPESILPYIKNNNITQIKLSAPVANNAHVEFTGGEDPDFAPVLNITYGNTSTLGIENEEVNPEVLVYPNPASEVINLSVLNSNLKSVRLLTIEGKEIMVTDKSTIDVSQVASGTYLLHISTDKGVLNKKIIVE